MTELMYDDEREIGQINDDSAGINIAIVGLQGVTKIEAYKEKGSLDYFPYFAIYKGDFLWKRIPAIGLSVYYKE